MSLASLAAYDSNSDEEDGDGEESTGQPLVASKQTSSSITPSSTSGVVQAKSYVTVNSEFQCASAVDQIEDEVEFMEMAPATTVNRLRDPVGGVDQIVDEDDDYVTRSVTSSLPVASSSHQSATGSGFQADDVVDDVPLADTLRSQRPVKGSKVKITIPSLSQFKDDDEPAAKKFKPSSKGSGLFSLLPPPRAQITKETKRRLVPHAVSRRSAAAAAAVSGDGPVPAPAAPPLSRPRPSTSGDSDPEDQTDDQPAGGGGDFFSLHSEPPRVPPIPTAAAGLLSPAPDTSGAASDQQMAGLMDAVNSGEPSDEMNLSYSYPPPGAIPMDTSRYRTSVPTAPSQQQRQQAHLDEMALQQLRGRRGRRDEAELAIIDVNQDDILPDRDEWLTKQLTQEPVVRRPQKSADDPTAQQRRKHQITYLAHQAKEREVELKNDWAKNRAAKNAYRSKYGF